MKAFKKEIMEARFTDFSSESNWCNGIVGEYTFEAKLFDDPSEYGINEGRVSKLCIRDRDKKWLVSYDREWDIEPNEITKPYFDSVMELLENSPKRFS